MEPERALMTMEGVLMSLDELIYFCFNPLVIELIKYMQMLFMLGRI